VAAGAAFVVDIIVSVAVTSVTKPRAEAELKGLVYSLTPKASLLDEHDGTLTWWQSPTKLAAAGLILVIILNLMFL
jgi:SSS family solute:Na+ symporter